MFRFFVSITARQGGYWKAMLPVVSRLSTYGIPMTISYNALDLTLPLYQALSRPTSIDIWWLFKRVRSVQAGGTHLTGMLSCLNSFKAFGSGTIFHGHFYILCQLNLTFLTYLKLSPNYLNYWPKYCSTLPPSTRIRKPLFISSCTI